MPFTVLTRTNLNNKDMNFGRVKTLNNPTQRTDIPDSLTHFGANNGCQTSLERFTDSKRKAFFGKCIVVLKGKGTLKAQVPNLKEAMLKF